jgi:CBS domain containing-hemolysin-like protein
LANYRFEVIDLEGRRIDKVLATKKQTVPPIF